MSELDETFIPLAFELCEEFGKDVVYKVVGQSTYSVTTQTSTPSITLLPRCKMFPPEDYSTYTIVNSSGLIEEGDKNAYIPAQYFIDAGLLPSEEDLVVFDNESWVVKKVLETYSGDQICIYQVQLRK